TRKLPEYPYEISRYAKKRCPVNHPAVMFKKTSVLFAGGYRSFPLFEDYYLWVRLLMNGAKFYNVQESLLLFRTSSDMYKRRGGLKHALTEIRFQNHIRVLGFIGLSDFIRNVLIRFTVRVMPNSVRGLVYHKLLRR
ncbi:MAG: amylovoran biosynthesis protein AmsE, partial [Rikenellaceae bacterium]|nr:amylovoran biosynthesis protein AmsE [Rikenellaceae bacterium]